MTDEVKRVVEAIKELPNDSRLALCRYRKAPVIVQFLHSENLKLLTAELESVTAELEDFTSGILFTKEWEKEVRAKPLDEALESYIRVCKSASRIDQDNAKLTAELESVTQEMDKYKAAIDQAIREINGAMILSIHAQQWKRISKAHSILILGLGNTDANSIRQALEEKTDEKT